MNIFKNLAVFCLLVLVLFVNACSGLTHSDIPATKTWWLEPYAGMAGKNSSATVVLLKISATAVPGLDTDRVLTLSDAAELNHYVAARWADNLPELVTSLLGRSLESSGRFEVVSVRSGGDAVNCDLQLELREFFADLSATGQTTAVRIAIFGRYQCADDTAIPIQLTAAVPVYENRMAVIIAAFQQAMDNVMRELLNQIT